MKYVRYAIYYYNFVDKQLVIYRGEIKKKLIIYIVIK